MSDSPSDSADPAANALPSTDGMSILDVLDLPADERHLVTWILRHGVVRLNEVTTYLSEDAEQGERLLHDLERRGFVKQITDGGDVCFRVQVMSQRKRNMGTGLWGAPEG
ncbi:MAG: hypothetical protein QOF51_2005 [Chloroflexota bacterium]|jgi:hypothetical protein|nr:hypothetical protein [Chloroflexota bacterium]